MAVENRLEERKKIGANIRAARERAGLSLAKVAALCGIDAADIGRIERAETSPELNTLLELAHALNVSPKEFF